MTEDPFLEDQIPEGRDDNAAEEAEHAKLPRLFTFPSPRIYAGHKKDDVQGGQGVEDLQREVPYMPAILGRRGNEYIEVSRAEDDGVENLGDERYTWGSR